MKTGQKGAVRRAINGRILDPENRKLDRNYCIWDAWMRRVFDQKGVAELMGCSPSVVSHVIGELTVLGTEEAIQEYFRIGFELSDMIAETGRNPDNFIFCIMRSLCGYGFRSRDDLVRASDEELIEISSTRRMRSIGPFVYQVLKQYIEALKREKKQTD